MYYIEIYNLKESRMFMVNMTAESIKNLPSSLWCICITRYWRSITSISCNAAAPRRSEKQIPQARRQAWYLFYRGFWYNNSNY